MKLIEYKNHYWKSNPILFKQLIELVDKSPKGYLYKLNSGSSKYHRIPPYRDLLLWINDSTKNISALKTPLVSKVYWILNGVVEQPMCLNPNCNNSLSEKAFNIHFQKQVQYCSRKCMRSDPHIHKKISNAAIKNKQCDPLFFKKVELKRKEGKIARDLSPNWNNIQKARRTIDKNIDNDLEFFKKIQEKRVKTNIRNGNPGTWNNRKKAIETRLEKNGGVWETKSQIKKRQQTSLERYGTKSPNSSPKVKQAKRESCLKKYNVDSYSKTEMYHQQMRNCNEQRKKKEFETKKRNKSFCSSKEEDAAYDILVQKFGKNDVER